MRASNLLDHYRQGINPPYSFRKRDVIALGATLFIFLALPITIFLVQTVRDYASRAAGEVTVTAEAENSTLSGSVTKASDSSASGGQSIQFGSTVTPPPSGNGSGKIRFYSKITSDETWNQSQSTMTSLMNNNYETIHMWKGTPYGNAYSAGPALTYVDFFVFSNGTSSYLPNANMSMVLKGTSGEYCYQYWFGPSRGGTPRFMMDITRSDVRAHIVSTMQNLLATTPTDGLYLDVTEPYLPAGVEGCNPSVSNSQYFDGWIALMQALDGLPGPLAGNTQPTHVEGMSGVTQAQKDALFRAIDLSENEHGWILNNTSTGGLSGWNQMVNHINYLHSLGTGIIIQEYSPGFNQCESVMSSAQEKYSLAMQFLVQNELDYYSTFSRDGRCDAGFNPVYNSDLGNATGASYTWNGLQRRDFANGTTLVNNPGGGSVTVSLGGNYQTLWDETVSSVTLGERQGTVLKSKLLASAEDSGSVAGVVQAATCPSPLPTDKGTATTSVNILGAATYKVWSRVMVPDTTNNSYWLKIGNECFNVGDSSSIPANTWTWVDYTAGSITNKSTLPLIVGNSTVSMIGKETGVKLDKLIITPDMNCVPTGTGSNCNVSGDPTPPTVSITAPTNGSTVSGAGVNITASASDNIGVTKIEFLIDNVVKGTDTSSPYAYTWDSTTATNASHSIVAKAYDAAGNIASSTVTVTVNNPVGTNLTFTSIADASIKEVTPDTNFGNSNIIEADNDPVEQFLVKFAVTGTKGKNITSAKLRLYNSNPSNSGGNIFLTSGSNWDETLVTWNDAPSTSGAAVASLGAVTASNWYELNVTSVVKMDGSFSFRMTSSSTDGADYYTKEQGSAFAPQLLITVSGSNPDSDADGFSDSTETFVGTNPLVKCGAQISSTLPGNPSTVWPPDLWTKDKSKGRVDIQDVISYLTPVRRLDNPSAYNKRYDLNTDGRVDRNDIDILSNQVWFNKPCS